MFKLFTGTAEIFKPSQIQEKCPSYSNVKQKCSSLHRYSKNV